MVFNNDAAAKSVVNALQQLAVDTDRDSDQAAVVEVLSAFVRLSLRAGFTPTGASTERRSSSGAAEDGDPGERRGAAEPVLGRTDAGGLRSLM